MLLWLQGDMQDFLPHDIMLAAWGDFGSGKVQHDIISTLSGMRSQNSSAGEITPMLIDLHARWTKNTHKPLAVNSREHVFSSTFQKMRSAMVHGISDKRASHDCLYIAFRTEKAFDKSQLSAMSELTPCIDAALRQVELLPQQAHKQIDPLITHALSAQLNLTDRETQVLYWVSLGKTNAVIGKLLNISAFTVKNHMQRIFNKLEVCNRAQAVGKLKTLQNHV